MEIGEGGAWERGTPPCQTHSRASTCPLPPLPTTPSHSLTALYRAVLRAHRTLPPPLRDLGDRTVRAEWAAMVRAAPPADSWQTFAGEWATYVRQLRQPGSGSGGLQPDQVAAMSADQLRSLEALKAEAARARDRPLWGTPCPAQRVMDDEREGRVFVCVSFVCVFFTHYAERKKSPCVLFPLPPPLKKTSPLSPHR